MDSFFELELPEQTQYKAPPSLIPQCGKCGLFRHCISPRIPVYGKGKREILIVGEVPGRLEDKKGKPFYKKAPAGGRIWGELDDLDIHLFRDCWVTDSLICHSNNKTPTNNQIDYCRPNVIKAIEILKPKVIILLGSVAIKSVVGWLFRSDCGGITKWAGWQIPSQKLNAWICPTFHPSFLERSKDVVLDLWFERHLKAAVELKDRPWEDVPIYRDQVQCLLDEKSACKRINQIIKAEKPTSFDFETDRLKSDHQEARIICCSMSNGEITIAFPWMAKTRKAFLQYLQSGIPSIGQNCKFELKWIKKEFGFWYDGFTHDDMLWSHTLDNRPGITGIEFQSFALLGFPPWDQKVSAYMKSKGGSNGRNRLHECRIEDLLLYCGIDSLVEWHVWKKQKQQIKELV